MKTLTLQGNKLVVGPGSISCLQDEIYNRAVIITGGNSMFATGVIEKIKQYLKRDNAEIFVYAGIPKNPTKEVVEKALKDVRKFKPDLMIAVGGGSAIDAAKAMLLLYEYPNLTFDSIVGITLPEERKKARFIAIPSTSGTASEVTHVTVITYPEKQCKVAFRSSLLRPDLAVLDGEITLSLPPRIAAEMGMDALTHAIEAFINKNGDEITQALTKEAVIGILRWLPESCSKGTIESRQKMHIYQCMAGMGFANSGLGMVHGVSHAFGGIYDTAHGLANAIILPYAMEYNKEDSFASEKFAELTTAAGRDIFAAVKALAKTVGIPRCFKEIGISEEQYVEHREKLINNSLGGSTVVNPRLVSEADMQSFVDEVYYGRK